MDLTKLVISRSDDESSDSDVDYSCKACNKSFPSYKSYEQHKKSAKHYKTILKIKRQKGLEKKLEDASEEDSDCESFTQNVYQRCETCDKDLYCVESYIQHLHSKKHKRKTRNQVILEKVTEDGKINIDKLRDLKRNVGPDSEAAMAACVDDGSDGDEARSPFECEVCQKRFSGLEPYSQHLVSKVHKKAAKQKRLLAKVTHADDDELGDAGPSRPSPSEKNEGEITTDDNILVCKLCHVAFTGPESALAHKKGRGHVKMLETRRQKKMYLEQEKRLAEKESDSEDGPEDQKDVLEAGACKDDEASSESDDLRDGDGHEGTAEERKGKQEVQILLKGRFTETHI